MPFDSSATPMAARLTAPGAWEATSRGRLCSDDERLAALLRDNFTAVWRALRRLGVSEDAADDAAQEVFIIAARRLAGVEVGHERPYLFGIALRVAANVRRKRQRSLECCDEELLTSAAATSPGTDLLLDEKRLRRMLEELLDKMPADLRTVFVLFEFEGFSEREVAELCSIPVGTAASRLRRARETFQTSVRRLKSQMSKGEP